jgi:hypothetical protein
VRRVPDRHSRAQKNRADPYRLHKWNRRHPGAVRQLVQCASALCHVCITTRILYTPIIPSGHLFRTLVMESGAAVSADADAVHATPYKELTLSPQPWPAGMRGCSHTWLSGAPVQDAFFSLEVFRLLIVQDSLACLMSNQAHLEPAHQANRANKACVTYLYNKHPKIFDQSSPLVQPNTYLRPLFRASTSELNLYFISLHQVTQCTRH